MRDKLLRFINKFEDPNLLRSIDYSKKSDEELLAYVKELAEEIGVDIYKTPTNSNTNLVKPSSPPPGFEQGGQPTTGIRPEAPPPPYVHLSQDINTPPLSSSPTGTPYANNEQRQYMEDEARRLGYPEITEDYAAGRPAPVSVEGKGSIHAGERTKQLLGDMPSSVPAKEAIAKQLSGLDRVKGIAGDLWQQADKLPGGKYGKWALALGLGTRLVGAPIAGAFLNPEQEATIASLPGGGLLTGYEGYDTNPEAFAMKAKREAEEEMRRNAMLMRQQQMQDYQMGRQLQRTQMYDSLDAASMYALMNAYMGQTGARNNNIQNFLR